LLYFQGLTPRHSVGASDAFNKGMKANRIRATWLMLLFFGLAAAAQSQTRGQLEVTAVVESSSAWVQGEDGKWVFVVANAPASRDTLSAALVNGQDQKQQSAQKHNPTKEKPASRRHLRA
jgi:hypothetical protein